MFAIDIVYLDGAIYRGFHANRLFFDGENHTLKITQSRGCFIREDEYQIIRNVKSFDIIQENYME